MSAIALPTSEGSFLSFLASLRLEENRNSIERLLADPAPFAPGTGFFNQNIAVATDLINVSNAISALDLKKEKFHEIFIEKESTSPYSGYTSYLFDQLEPCQTREFKWVSEHANNSIFVIVAADAHNPELYIGIYKRDNKYMHVTPAIPNHLKNANFHAYGVGSIAVSQFHLLGHSHTALKPTVANQTNPAHSIPQGSQVDLSPEISTLLAGARLDADQRAMVECYLRMNEGLGTVWGPFGTGKSTALSRMLVLLSKQFDANGRPRRALVSAHANRAVLRTAEAVCSLYTPVQETHQGDGIFFSNPWFLTLVGHPSKLRLRAGDPLLKFSLELKARAVKDAVIAAKVVSAAFEFLQNAADNAAFDALLKLADPKEHAGKRRGGMYATAEAKALGFIMQAMVKDGQLSSTWRRDVASMIRLYLVSPHVAALSEHGITYESLDLLALCPRMQDARSDASLKHAHAADEIKSLLSYMLNLHNAKFEALFEKATPLNKVTLTRVTEIFNRRKLGNRKIRAVPDSETRRIAGLPVMRELPEAFDAPAVFIPYLKEIFCSAATIVCATSTSYVSISNDKEAFRDFSDVLVDEAGQIQEPSARIPLRKGTRVMLIGDPKQLPPFFSSVSRNEARRLIVQSMLQRVQTGKRCWPKNSTHKADGEILMLRTQYRCLPEVSNFISEMVYDNEVVNGPNVVRPDRAASVLGANVARDWAGVSFIRPSTFAESMGIPAKYFISEPIKVGASWCNFGEAIMAVSALRTVLRQLDESAGLNGPNAPEVSVKIVTPYRAQANLIEGLLSESLNEQESFNREIALQNGFVPGVVSESAKRNRNLQKHFRLSRGRKVQIDVRTIDGVQGDESDILFLSPVHTSEFANDVARTNVALTRAKLGLVIVTDSRVNPAGRALGLLNEFIRRFQDKKSITVGQIRKDVCPTMEQLKHHKNFM